jgi:hypothetical protein
VGVGGGGAGRKCREEEGESVRACSGYGERQLVNVVFK